MEEKILHSLESKYVMASEPCPNLSAEEMSKLICEISTEKELAILFALSDNQAWWVEDDIYDYEEGTQEYQKACEITDRWFAIADELKKRIFAILQAEGVSIPESGQITVLAPFMERNGFFDGNGWWIQKGKE